MVETSEDVMDINPMERMDKLKDIAKEKKATIASKRRELKELEKKKDVELEELERQKNREIAEIEHRKKKEIEEVAKKKKELQELEQQKVKEIEETEELIEKSFQDLMRHKRKIIHDEEELQKTKNSLLEDVASTAPKNKNNTQGTDYGRTLEQLQAPRDIYDVTNRGFYSSLTEIRNRAASGEITAEEERFVEQLRSQFGRFEEQTIYDKDKDQNNYVRRSLNILEQIDNYTIKR
jgi:hypothetical protein